MSENKEEYRRFIQDRPDIPVFFQDWWLDVVSEGQSWDVILVKDKANEISLVLPYLIRSKFGFKLSSQPPLTPFLGAKIFYPRQKLKQAKQYSFEHKLLDQLSEQLNQQGLVYYNQLFPSTFSNWKPLFWKGFQQTTFYRFVITGIKDSKATFEEFKYNKKYEINKFEQSGHVIETSEDAGLMYDLIDSSYQNDQSKIPFSKILYFKLNEALDKNGHRKIFITKDKAGNIIAALLLIVDFDRAYLLNTGMDYQFKDSSAKTALIWHSIQYAAEFVDTYDFCGSMIRPISDFFQGFGGTLEPYFRIYRYRDNLVKTIFTLMGK